MIFEKRDRKRTEKRVRERGRSRKKGLVKTVLEYSVGVLGLGIALTIAWFFPGWYSRWQDEMYLNGQVTLGSREEIQFLNTDSLDIAGRMKMLEDFAGPQMDWVSSGIGMYSYEDNYLWPDELLLVGESLNNVADRFNRMIEMWQEADLLPLPNGVKVTAKQIFDGKVEVGVYDIYLERSVLPVYILVIENPRMVIVMDRDKDVVYYMSVSGGEQIWDGMAGYLGFDSYQELWSWYFDGHSSSELEDCSDSDFASVCGAVSARKETENTEETDKARGVVTELPEDGEMNVSGVELKSVIQYETFSTMAYRQLIVSEQGYGMAVMYGTESWMDMVSRIFNIDGTAGSAGEYAGTFDEWLKNPQWLKNELNMDTMVK